MRIVVPTVTLLAVPTLDPILLGEYLDRVGAPDWTTDTECEAEELIEVAGRLCYRSFAPDLNPNVTRVREGNRPYLENILKSHHGSVLEHAQVSFILENVSRVLTHEIVRHRAGCAISQESMRYVRLTDIPWWDPPSVAEDPVWQEARDEVLAVAEKWQRRLAAHWELDNREVEFPTKKAKTSAMRRLAPHGVATALIWSVNLRTLRHVLALRTDLAAEEEIRLVFDQIGDLARTVWPNVFQDFTRTADGVWTPKHPKV